MIFQPGFFSVSFEIASAIGKNPLLHLIALFFWIVLISKPTTLRQLCSLNSGSTGKHSLFTNRH